MRVLGKLAGLISQKARKVRHILRRSLLVILIWALRRSKLLRRIYIAWRRLKRRLKKDLTWSRVAHGLMAVVVLVSIVPVMLISPLFQGAAAAVSFSAGPRSATSSSDCVDDNSIGTITWGTPGEAYSSNNTYATTPSMGKNAVTHYLKCTNFGFTIPTGSTIDGITLSIERKAGTANRLTDSSVRIVKGGTIGSTNRSAGAAWSVTEGSVTFGSTSDKWGETWEAGDINSSGFGAAISATASNTVVGYVDHMTLTVQYTINPIFEQSAYQWFNNQDSDNSTFAITWGGNSTDQANAITVDSIGNIFVAGSSKSTGLSSETTSGDQTLVKYNPSGVEQWSKSWGGDSLDFAYDLALDTSGNIYVAGYTYSTSMSSGLYDQTLVKYNPSGVEQWSKTWGGTGSDIAFGLALDDSGNIFVAGSSSSTGLSSETTSRDLTLVKYNSSGVEQWSKSWGG